MKLLYAVNLMVKDEEKIEVQVEKKGQDESSSIVFQITGNAVDLISAVKDSVSGLLPGLVSLGEQSEKDVEEKDKQEKNVKGNEKQNVMSFFAFSREEIRRLQQNGQISTARNYLTAIHSLERFLRGKDLPFPDMNTQFVERYEDWLLRQGICLNSVSSYMRVLRAIFNKAIKQELVEQKLPFLRAYTKIETTYKRAIRPDMVKRIIDLKLRPGTMEALTRDLFVFSFFARGMPFVDLAYLKKDQIRGGYIFYKRKKTNQQLCVKMEDCMEKIVRRYATSKSPYVFPIISSEDFFIADRQYRSQECYHNKILKKIGRMLKLEYPLSFYVARHTWASTAHNTGIPLETISRAMGHTSVQTTKIYIQGIEYDRVVNDANSVMIENLVAAQSHDSDKGPSFDAD